MMFQVEPDETPVTHTEFRAFRKLSWFRILFGITTAVVVSLIVVSATVRDNNVSNCYRTAASSNATAENWATAAKIRRHDGDPVVADEYLKNSLNIRAQIYMPHGWTGDLSQRGVDKHLRELGCRQAFPPPLPFIG